MITCSYILSGNDKMSQNGHRKKTGWLEGSVSINITIDQIKIPVN